MQSVSHCVVPALVLVVDRTSGEQELLGSIPVRPQVEGGVQGLSLSLGGGPVSVVSKQLPMCVLLPLPSLHATG